MSLLDYISSNRPRPKKNLKATFDGRVKANDNEKRKEAGHHYIGPQGEILRHRKNKPPKLVIAPKNYHPGHEDEKSKIVKSRDGEENYQRLYLMVQMKEAVLKILDLQENISDDQIQDKANPPWAAHQKKLSESYEAFKRQFGPINKTSLTETGRQDKDGETQNYLKHPNLSAMKKDPDVYLLAAMEDYDAHTGEAQLGSIIRHRYVRPSVSGREARSLEEAVGVSIDEFNRIDLDYIAQIYPPCVGRDGVVEALREEKIAFLNPETEQWEAADEYLSGNLKRKIRLAEEAVKAGRKELKANVEALNAHAPADIGFEDINISLGNHWIPAQIYKEFAQEVMGLDLGHIKYVPDRHFWQVKAHETDQKAQKFETEFVDSHKVFRACLNERKIVIKRTKDAYGREIDPALHTDDVQEKQREVHQAFKDWVGKKASRRKELAAIYNQRFNAHVPRNFDGKHLSFAGSAVGIKLYPHQKNAVARILSGQNALLEHMTGSGKTFTAIAAIEKMLVRGDVKKPLMAVPPNKVTDFARDYRKLYPRRNVLVVDPDTLLDSEEKGLELEKRMDKILEKIQDHEGPVIMSHATYDRFDVGKKNRFQKLIDDARKAQEQVRNFRLTNGQADTYLVGRYRDSLKKMAAFLGVEPPIDGNNEYTEDYEYDVEAEMPIGLGALNSNPWDRFLAAEMVPLLRFDAKEDEWKEALSKVKLNPYIKFEKTEIDYILGDEEHGYKNHQVTSRHAGLSIQGSDKTVSHQNKLDHLRRKNPSCYHTSMTWTPVSNSPAEVYTMLGYLMPELLEEYGIRNFDAFASMFFETERNFEIAPEGGFRYSDRISRFKNVPELVRLYLQFADIVSADMLDLKVPESEMLREDVPSYPELNEFLGDLRERAMIVAEGLVDSSEDNILKIMNEANMATLSPRLVGLEVPEGTVTKLDVAADNIAKTYHENKDRVFKNKFGQDDPLTGALQMAIIDIGVPKGDGEYSVYHDLKEKLIERGVPAKKIEFIQDHASAVKREEIQRRCDEGEVAVLLGTTESIGTGMNVQKRLIAAHQLLKRWRPSDDDQILGRGDRQGNQNKLFQMIAYAVENSPDAYRFQTLARKSGLVQQLKNKDLFNREIGVDDQTRAYMEGVAAIVNNHKIFDLHKVTQEIYDLERDKSLLENQGERAKNALEDINERIAESGKALRKNEAVAKAVEETPPQRVPLRIGEKGFRSKKDSAAALKEYLRDLRAELKAGAFTAQKDIGTFYGFPVHLSAVQVESKGEKKEGEADGQTQAQKFVVEIALPEPVRVEVSLNDIRQIEAERDLARLEKGQDDKLSESFNDRAGAEDRVAAANLELLDKIMKPVSDIVQSYGEEKERLRALRNEREALKRQKRGSVFKDDARLAALICKKQEIEKSMQEEAANDNGVPQYMAAAGGYDAPGI